MSTESAPKPTIRFRGRNFLALVVAPDPPLDEWLAHLDDWLTRAPAFFKGRPVILDLSAMKAERSEIPAIVAAVQARNVRVMGVDGADVEWLGIGTPAQLLGGKGDPAPEFRAEGSPAAGVAAGIVATAPEIKPETPHGEGDATSLVLAEPVRSGQQIYFPRGDVTVIGAVQFGAEIVAGGSITVHGPLRGRAIAGVSGNARSRIFCRRFEAELLSIDGVYKTADDVDPALIGKPAQAWLEGDTLRTAVLD
ncbi:putative septum site-determining protein MinC [Alsobacter metallidurans]|uniref:Probable septum site-determining protein MinC n=1 Tax=Alsobacter metallidurans TaxID=340221 RepID=A0A917I6T1_9HYPH|nr:septum site-determining protein MinC [Alsobacter metallidurans]GGH18446.1 putative septum site-determining protein MinC [Alsobacter metallidurans]